MTRPRLFLFDAFAHIFRAFFAIKNIDYNAVFGFTKVLLKVLQEESPEFAVAVFDTPEPSFRNHLYPLYKANREAIPEGLIPQIPLVKEVLQAHRIPILQKPGFEADDVIGSLAEQAAAQGIQAVIVSSDKDFLQLLRGDDIVFFDPYREIKYLGEDGVEEFFGVRADQIIDLLTIWGDSSDNIPGVPGVGEKGAKNLIRQFGSVAEVYQNLDHITRKSYRAGLEKARDHMSLMRDLATIRRDVDVTFDPQAANFGEPDSQRVRDLFIRLNFRSLLQDEPASDLASCATDYDVIDTREKIQAWIKAIRAKGFFVFDVETTSLDPEVASVVGIALAYSAGKAGYIPLRHEGQDPQWTNQAEELLRGLFVDNALTKCAHNLKFDMAVLRARGWKLVGPYEDTMLMSYLIEPTARHHKLDDLAESLLSYRTITFSELCGQAEAALTFDQVPVDKAATYAAEDADICFQLHQRLAPKLHELRLESVYREIEVPLVSVLADMEHHGILVDIDHLKKLSRSMATTLRELEEEIFDLAGEKFNVRSTQQLGKILFDKLELPVIGKTQKTKHYSTNQAVLERLAGMGFPLPQKLLEYRMVSKLKSTYVDKIPKMVHEITGRVHSEFNQFVTATGRLSSTNPNLQNIPIRSEMGRDVRAAFIAQSGWILLAADYSQIELRLLAHFSHDETLVTAFLNGEDIHRRTASEIMGIELDEVTDDARRAAKAINFGLIYGMSDFRLGQELGIPQKVAKAYVESYFQRMPRVPEFQARLIEEVKKTQEVRTHFGRRRAIPEINSKNKTLQKQAERLAVNTRIQGTAADIIKSAMIDLDEALRNAELRARILLQVHDELVLECPLEEESQTVAVLKKTMQEVVAFDVPLTVDVHRGENWKEAK